MGSNIHKENATLDDDAFNASSEPGNKPAVLTLENSVSSVPFYHPRETPRDLATSTPRPGNSASVRSFIDLQVQAWTAGLRSAAQSLRPATTTHGEQDWDAPQECTVSGPSMPTGAHMGQALNVRQRMRTLRTVAQNNWDEDFKDSLVRGPRRHSTPCKAPSSVRHLESRRMTAPSRHPPAEPAHPPPAPLPAHEVAPAAAIVDDGSAVAQVRADFEDSSLRGPRRRSTPGKAPSSVRHLESWDDDFEDAPLSNHVTPKRRRPTQTRNSSDEDEFGAAEEEDCTVTARVRRMPLAKAGSVFPPPQRLPANSVFKFSIPPRPPSATTTHYGSTTHLTHPHLQPTSCGLANLPLSPPIHHQRRRLRKKSCPQPPSYRHQVLNDELDDGQFEQDEEADGDAQAVPQQRELVRTPPPPASAPPSLPSSPPTPKTLLQCISSCASSIGPPSPALFSSPRVSLLLAIVVLALYFHGLVVTPMMCSSTPKPYPHGFLHPRVFCIPSG
ncbi:hypothetical protein PLICRDRAFT_180719 [Plicaturopsis crispa FD-325 SS-3]|uniref:Unplaced genomic scaffold PLICRscaffold_30, whole genome shotgun sequence n=1 Tax=Plicaturopsis crispa FD-325 SS-3 TaxID=944288 RepID=A0A0C9T4Q6_PLICR|nr:hypothetical protein PLICRDRAFT_180719 [Plicaturopsis crispa FD-325 SS-3]